RDIDRGFPDGRPIRRRHTKPMPPSTGPSSGDGALPDWQQVQTLRVADVVMTILKARKAMPSATAAAVSRARHGGGYRVLVSLLEDSKEADAPGLGVAVDGAAAVFVARELAQDLADAFGDKDVFILQ
ncbi:MAG TPA: hypothetical protein VN835_02150, partial [Steroidobacteraceae bacterium]|nr:hypothetical protein [Steroidobacteraceae bacterium]